MIWIELLVLLTCIYFGSRLGGMAMGTMGGLGLVVFVFLFGLPPGGPPVIVLGMILTVITALSCLEAAGGLDYLVGLAENILRKNPRNITFVAPLVTFFLIMISGTQHVIYALLPVISEISRKSNIRPERPISISVIASMFGLIASPISAATVALVSTLAEREVSIGQIMAITIPSGIIAVLIGSLAVLKMGPDLDKDEEWLKISKDITDDKGGAKAALTGKELFNARSSLILFFSAVFLVVLMGLIPGMRPMYKLQGSTDGQVDQLDMAIAIMMIMMATGALTMLFFKASPGKAVGGPIMKSGVVAVLSILGISWLGSSFFEGNKIEIVSSISTILEGHQWIFAVGLFFLSMMLFSQAATIVTLMPVALSLAIPTTTLLAVYPAVNGLFFLPTYGTILAAVSFDRTGTTKIGKYVLNHSFMLPGLVVIATSLVISFTIVSFMF